MPSKTKYVHTMNMHFKILMNTKLIEFNFKKTFLKKLENIS